MKRHQVPDIHRLGWATGAAARLVALAGRVGADPLESSEAALPRRLLVLMSVGTLPMTVLWSVTYFAAGVPLAASAPAVYSVVTPINTALLVWTRNFRLYRFTQLLMILVLPWVVMTSLGGFKESSVVIIWAALCPLVSLLVEDLRRTVLWIVGFVLLLIVSAILQPYLTPSRLPEAFVTWFFVLNLGSVIAIVFALLYYFVGQRNFFQERSEALLLNILPREISEALRTNRSAIAAITSQPAFSSPMSSASRRWPQRSFLGVWSISSTTSSIASTIWWRSTTSRRSRPSGTAPWSPAGCHGRDRPRGHPRATRAGHREAVANPDIRGSEARVPHWHQLWPCGGRRHRPQEVHLRSLGRARESGEPYRIPGRERDHPITRSTYDLIKDQFDANPEGPSS